MPAAGRLYLVGFMGSGKTTVGWRLAERRGMPFVDLDTAFEAMAGRTIRATFETHGEPWFREREAELLHGTEDLPEAVVALGGGTFMVPANRAFVKSRGASAFLDVPFDVIAARLGGKTADRPLFSSLEEAHALYETRRPFYKMSDWTIPVSASQTVDDVVARLDAVLGRRTLPAGGC